MMSAPLKNKLLDYFKSQLSRYWEEMLVARDVPSTRPFHYALSPKASQAWFGASERSFSTRSGTWWQNTMLWIADEYHPFAEQNHRVIGNLSPAADSHINQILEDMDKGTPHRIPNRERDIDEVLTVQQTGTGSRREVVSDLFFITSSDQHVYIEIKTPGPNKGTSKEMKQKILTISALMKDVHCTAIAGGAYNPDGEQEYRPQYLKQFLELGSDHLIGSDLWDFIGEKGTYEEILEICQNAGVSDSNMEEMFFDN